MKRNIAITLAMLLLSTLALAPANAQGPTDSIIINSGAGGSCSGVASDGIMYLLVSPTLSGNGSDRGVVTAPGFGTVAYVENDHGFRDVTAEPYGLPIITTYSVPAGTILEATITTFSQPGQSGSPSYESKTCFDCSTGALAPCPGESSDGTPVPGCDMRIDIPSTAIGGRFVSDAGIHWEPGQMMYPALAIEAGQSALVFGQDESSSFYQILWSCDLLWVEKGTMGPNYDNVWNGHPLPTDVVE